MQQEDRCSLLPGWRLPWPLLRLVQRLLELQEPGPRLRPAASLLPRLVPPSWRLLGRLWRLLRRTGPRLRDPRLEELRLEEPGPRQLLAASLLLRLAALRWRVLGSLLRLLQLLRLLEPR